MILLDQYDILNQLRGALRTDQFVLHYQPKVELQSGRLTGMEALIRWQHPSQGLLSPDAFLPVAQNAGLIPAIGDWVLRSVCRQLIEWQAAGIALVPIAVNIGAEHFEQEKFTLNLACLLENTGLNPASLELELTESTLLQDTERAIPVFQRVKAMGVKLSMDDFGSGYSGLSYLSGLHFDNLKIDRSFIRSIVTNPVHTKIVAAVISMAHSLGLQVVAEGVESSSQVGLLSRIGCDAVQGYYFSPPCAVPEAEKLLRQVRFEIPDHTIDAQNPWVLILDDQIEVAHALERTLKSEGYRAEGVCSPSEALSLMAKQPARMVIADQQMPQMQGIDFLQHIKTLYPETVRVLISGQADMATLSDAINKHCVDKFILKPWNKYQLLSDIKQAIKTTHSEYFCDEPHRENMACGLSRLHCPIPLSEPGSSSLDAEAYNEEAAM
jgi:EAL domain-containing protein (putative c-di-GMP-specific phosphodiesterase class I)/FixJ family two-component response regulator